MFGIGISELILILAIALIFLGPKRLPELARSLGKGLNEFRRAASDIKSSLDMEEDLSSAMEEVGSPDENPYPYREKAVKKTKTAKKTAPKKTGKTTRKTGRKTSKNPPAG
jgi:sec-independent protein translocase protein TatB